MPPSDLLSADDSTEETLKSFLECAGLLRGSLHGYCSRMVGSAIDGEDAVQEALMRAHSAVLAGSRPAEMRFWLFRLAHNCSVDLVRRRRPEIAVDMEYLAEQEDDKAPNALELAERKEAVEAAMSSFLKLSAAQRSTVVLKDVLGYELLEISHLLNMPLTAVKAALHRGRRRLSDVTNSASQSAVAPHASPQLKKFVTLFNNHDWAELTQLLSQEVLLSQTARADLRGRQQVAAKFFKGYEETQGWRLQEALLEGRECAAVFADTSGEPSYVMLLDWQDGMLSRIRDFRYARYMLKSTRVQL